MPRGDRTQLVQTRLGIDHSGGAKLGPGELLGAGPDELDRLACPLRQACRLDGALARVLAAEPATEVGNDHADLVVEQPEGANQFRLDPERNLRAGPGGQLAAKPLGDRRSRLQRRVLDVGDLIRRLEPLRGPRQFALERVGGGRFAGPAAEVVGQRGARRLGFLLPLRGVGQGVESGLREPGRRGGDPDEIALAHHHHHAVDRPSWARSIAASFAPNDAGRRTLPYIIPGRAMSEGYWCEQRSRRGHWAGGATGQGSQTGRRGQPDVGGDARVERSGGLRIVREVGVSDRSTRGRVERHAGAKLDFSGINPPTSRGQIDQQIASGGTPATDRGDGVGSRLAAISSAIVGDEVGVGHHQADPIAGTRNSSAAAWVNSARAPGRTRPCRSSP